MADFLQAFESMIRNEGGYKLHSVEGDRGGMTYADTQMQMLRDDAAVMGTPLGDYEDLIAEVESGQPA